jgi:hypothetical protein
MGLQRPLRGWTLWFTPDLWAWTLGIHSFSIQWLSNIIHFHLLSAHTVQTYYEPLLQVLDVSRCLVQILNSSILHHRAAFVHLWWRQDVSLPCWVRQIGWNEKNNTGQLHLFIVKPVNNRLVPEEQMKIVPCCLHKYFKIKGWVSMHCLVWNNRVEGVVWLLFCFSYCWFLRHGLTMYVWLSWNSLCSPGRPLARAHAHVYVCVSVCVCVYMCVCVCTLYFICIDVLPVCMFVSDFGVPYSCELLCGCWKLNPGLLEEQSVLLSTEPSLQSCNSSWGSKKKGDLKVSGRSFPSAVSNKNGKHWD